MKRSDISGFSLRLKGFVLEVVTVKRLPRVIALSNYGGLNTLVRWEW